MGLSKIHRLTQDGTDYTLRVDLEDFENETRYAKYSTFNIGNSTTDYTITVGGYSGDAGNSICAVTYNEAWWYKDCYYSNLNGLYLGGSHESNDGIAWYHWRRFKYTLTEMKL